MKMKIDLHPKIGERERLIIPISEFSFAAYPVLINQVPHPTSAPVTLDKLQWRGWIQQILHRLRRACGAASVAPVSKLVVEQAVP
jgi:hypothetical protein